VSLINGQEIEFLSLSRQSESYGSYFSKTEIKSQISSYLNKLSDREKLLLKKLITAKIFLKI